jgi:hypothetical protein
MATTPNAQSRLRATRYYAASKESPQTKGRDVVARIEEVELNEQRGAIRADLQKLVEKYRAIFDWNVPDIDQPAADKLILKELRNALDDLERTIST